MMLNQAEKVTSLKDRAVWLLVRWSVLYGSAWNLFAPIPLTGNAGMRLLFRKKLRQKVVDHPHQLCERPTWIALSNLLQYTYMPMLIPTVAIANISSN